MQRKCRLWWIPKHVDAGHKKEDLLLSQRNGFAYFWKKGICFAIQRRMFYKGEFPAMFVRKQRNSDRRRGVARFLSKFPYWLSDWILHISWILVAKVLLSLDQCPSLSLLKTILTTHDSVRILRWKFNSRTVYWCVLLMDTFEIIILSSQWWPAMIKYDFGQSDNDI